MATPEENKDLSAETAQTILEAIKEAASDTGQRSGAEGLHHLAQAYAAVHGVMRKPRGAATVR